MVKEIKILIIGEVMYIMKLDFEFKLNSFLISLIASVIGWRIPIIATLLGPLRFCVYLMIFRSISVKNAILTIIEMAKIIIFKNFKIIKCKIFTYLNSKFKTFEYDNLIIYYL